MGMEMRVKDRREHLAMAWQINRSTTAGTPNFRIPPEGLGIITLRTGCGR